MLSALDVVTTKDKRQKTTRQMKETGPDKCKWGGCCRGDGISEIFLAYWRSLAFLFTVRWGSPPRASGNSVVTQHYFVWPNWLCDPTLEKRFLSQASNSAINVHSVKKPCPLLSFLRSIDFVRRFDACKMSPLVSPAWKWMGNPPLLLYDFQRRGCLMIVELYAPVFASLPCSNFYQNSCPHLINPILRLQNFHAWSIALMTGPRFRSMTRIKEWRYDFDGGLAPIFIAFYR